MKLFTSRSKSNYEPVLKIFSTEVPKKKIDYFKWAKEFKVGTQVKNEAYEDKNIINASESNNVSTTNQPT